jgi:CHAT domain-containing protein
VRPGTARVAQEGAGLAEQRWQSQFVINATFGEILNSCPKLDRDQLFDLLLYLSALSGYEWAAYAESVAQLLPETDRFIAVGFEATREAVLGVMLDEYRIVHFATHALIDSRYPDLSAIALSQLDVRGAAKEGFLGLPDIYGLTLNADLVVLSACETALGREGP